MDPRKLFFDERLQGICVYCGARANTRDHVPSRVLIDKPYPQDLPVVGACLACNNAFSKDEPYLACIVECAVRGSADPDQIGREKVRRILAEKPHVRKEMEDAFVRSESGVFWVPDMHRVTNVVLKLARGHAAYEFAEPRYEEPVETAVEPLVAMTPERRARFESDEDDSVVTGWPEIGSRAFYSTLVTGSDAHLPDGGWAQVQQGRYRYNATPGPRVRIVLSEYLACEIVWE